MKKPGKDRRLRRRIIAVFLVAVMLPSLILAYLGSRYIKQEEQWQEELVIRSLEMTLVNAAKQIEQDINQTILKVFDSLTVETSLPVSVVPQQLHKFPTIHSLVEELFVLDQNGKLLFPRSFGIRKPSGENQLFRSSTTLKQQLIRGEEAEARLKYDNAIKEYTAGLDDCTSKREKLTFFIRIARCLYKIGDLDLAQQTYQQVMIEDANQFIGEELPYQFIAALQLAQIFSQTGEHVEAFEILVQLYRNILNEFQRFEQRQLKFYLERISAELKVYLKPLGSSSSDLLDSLARIEEVFLQEPAHHNFLKSKVVPTIETAMHMKSEPNVMKYFLIDNTDNLIHIAIRELGDRSQRIRIIGALLSSKYLRKLVMVSLKDINVGENLSVVLLDNNNSLTGSDKTEEFPIVEKQLRLLAGTMPGYRLALVGTQGMSIEKFTFRGVIPYYALILVITVVIAFGVIFIFHDLSREHELTRMKSKFISNVTHEIKTPITTIRSLAENVNEGWVTSADKQRDYFQLIARESERLGHLVENTLDFSRIESGSKNFRMKLNSSQEVIEKTVERFRKLMQGQEVRISCELGKNLPVMQMDVEAIGQAILNLLDNAAKYSPQNKVITLKALAEGDHLKIAVSDRGIGIEKKDLSKIFEKFYRSESNAGKNITGSGIGLTIVKEIVEAHNGHIEVVSELNNGSTFTIYIPIIREESNGKDFTD